MRSKNSIWNNIVIDITTNGNDKWHLASQRRYENEVLEPEHEADFPLLAALLNDPYLDGCLKGYHQFLLRLLKCMPCQLRIHYSSSRRVKLKFSFEGSMTKSLWSFSATSEPLCRDPFISALDKLFERIASGGSDQWFRKAMLTLAGCVLSVFMLVAYLGTR